MSELLVACGEPSGDRAAARVVAALGARVRAFGAGGPALEAEKVELVRRTSHSSAMGVTEVAARAFAAAADLVRLERLAKQRRPKAALLVGWSEVNARLAPALRRVGTRVLWYAPPQVWAWRPHRAKAIRESVDALAVILPFEERFWRDRGASARYVGHPVVEIQPKGRAEARAALGLTETAAAIAILPGSRAHEVRRLARPMLAAYEAVRRDRASVDARLLLAPGLDRAARAFALREARELRVPCVDTDARAGAYESLPAFDAALCASGTASLEAALARAMPVIAYRVSLVTELVVRPQLLTPHVGLPNVLLGRATFPELLQRDVTPQKLARSLGRVLDARAALGAACSELEAMLRPPAGVTSPSRAVAEMLEAWL